MKLQIFTFKWGTKYGPEYVNRLYGSLLRHVNVPFDFTCITDDTFDIHPDISTLEYSTFASKFNSYPKDRLFTREKLELFNYSHAEHNILLDLDILIHSDITDIVSSYHEKPTFVFNANGGVSEIKFGYGQMTSTLVNSSFVGWSGDCGQEIYDYTMQNLEKVMFTYSSLDRYLFYQHHRKGNLKFWPEDIFYNYNYGNVGNLRDDSKRIVLFNTSHLHDEECVYELHECSGWAKDIWESYEQ